MGMVLVWEHDGVMGMGGKITGMRGWSWRWEDDERNEIITGMGDGHESGVMMGMGQ